MPAQGGPRALALALGAHASRSLAKKKMPCAEFVQLVATQANTQSEKEKKTTVLPEHVVAALEACRSRGLLRHGPCAQPLACAPLSL